MKFQVNKLKTIKGSIKFFWTKMLLHFNKEKCKQFKSRFEFIGALHLSASVERLKHHPETSGPEPCCLLWQNLLVINQEICLGLARPWIGHPWAKTNPTSCWISVSFFLFLFQEGVNTMYPSIPKPMHISCPCFLSNLKVLALVERHRRCSFFCFDVPTSCTWLQLVHGLFLSYYL